MTPEILEWVNKAEGDWQTLSREFVVTDDPNFDAICFHSQQCVEKYFKARLVKAGTPFRKSHDLLYLHELVLRAEPSWTFLLIGLSAMNSYAVASRYPGLDATEEQTKRAVEHCREIRKLLRISLGLPANY
ncbi:HEPN domain-containing protein [soil metagenome]